MELSPADLALIYGKPGWGLGDTIKIDTLGEWGITIGEDDYVGATIVHTGVGVVIQTGTLLGDEVAPTATATPTNTNTNTWLQEEVNVSTYIDSVNDINNLVVRYESYANQNNKEAYIDYVVVIVS